VECDLIDKSEELGEKTLFKTCCPSRHKQTALYEGIQNELHPQLRNSMEISYQLEAPVSSPLVSIKIHVHSSNTDDYGARYLHRENTSPITGPRLKLESSKFETGTPTAIPSRLATHNTDIKKIAL
jgi:hypothetical protein